LGRGLHISFHDSPFSSSQTLNWFNTVFDRCTVNLTHYGTYPGFLLDQRNNLFYRGNYAYSTYGTNTLSWTVKDCLFDCDYLSHWGELRITNSNNGYRSDLSPLQGGGSNRVNLTISYLAGPATNWYGVLGTFYYPTNGGTNTLTDLINAGSRNAGVAGLGVSSSTGSFDSAGSGAISPAHPRTNPQRGSRRPLTRAVTPAPSGENGFSPTGCSRKVMFRSGFASSTSNP